ncbi:MAG: RNA polymerase [Terriglobia bacterium]|nr:MAG: RNA polymerase [Terriglobia bacterium]
MPVNRPAEETDDRPLVEAAQRDPARFAALYEIHFERVYAFIARRVGDRNAAEDLTSDVFHRALAKLGNYESRGAPFAAWLLRIAANLVADHTKRSLREVTGGQNEPEPSLQPDLEAIEHQAQLIRLVDQLPPDQRRVIFERFVEQRSVREIAGMLGKTQGAVKQLQFRALQTLRTQMEGAHA